MRSAAGVAAVGTASGNMLELSRTVGYAILALSCLEEAAQEWVLLKDIVGRVNVPGPYLAKILRALAQVGVVHAKRGYRGGFMLARPSAEVALTDIVDAVEGRGWLGGCMLGFTVCTEDRACPAHTFCKTERIRIRSFLETLTLKDVAEFELRHGALPSSGKVVKAAQVTKKNAAKSKVESRGKRLAVTKNAKKRRPDH